MTISFRAVVRHWLWRSLLVLVAVWLPLRVTCGVTPLGVAEAASGDDKAKSDSDAGANDAGEAKKKDDTDKTDTVNVIREPRGRGELASTINVAFDKPLRGERPQRLAFKAGLGVHVRMWVAQSEKPSCADEETATAVAYVRYLFQTMPSDPQDKRALGILDRAKAILEDLPDTAAVRAARDDEDKARQNIQCGRLHGLDRKTQEEKEEELAKQGPTNGDNPAAFPIKNWVYDYASDNGAITLPDLQYGITYCFDIQFREGDAGTVERAYHSTRVAWPLTDLGNASWWSDRYVTATIGLGLNFWESINLNNVDRYGYDTTTRPFIYGGAHVYPCPTDRRIASSDRVMRRWYSCEHIHVLIAGAILDPWPNANTRTTLGLKGVVIGTGYSLWDNVASLSLGVVIGTGLYKQTNADTGVVRDRNFTLFSPMLSLSTQWDVVGTIGKFAGKVP